MTSLYDIAGFYIHIPIFDLTSNSNDLTNYDVIRCDVMCDLSV